MKNVIYRVEWKTTDGYPQSKDFDDRIAALSYREWLKSQYTLIYSSVCKVEER